MSWEGKKRKICLVEYLECLHSSILQRVSIQHSSVCIQVHRSYCILLHSVSACAFIACHWNQKLHLHSFAFNALLCIHCELRACSLESVFTGYSCKIGLTMQLLVENSSREHLLLPGEFFLKFAQNCSKLSQNVSKCLKLSQTVSNTQYCLKMSQTCMNETNEERNKQNNRNK